VAPADLPPFAESSGIEGVEAIVVRADGQRLYRIIRTDVPEVTDFLSNRDRHRVAMRGETWLLHNGISMFSDPAVAEGIRDQYRPTQQVAEVPLARGVGISLAKTRRNPTHYTVWGQPEVLLALALENLGYPVDKEVR
jgi:hypothetical protein